MFHTFSGIFRSLEQGTICCNVHISHIFHRFQVTCNKGTIQFNHTYILCELYMWTMHIRLFSVPMQWHKMYRKCPEHPSSRLLTTAAERNKLPTGLLFLFFFALFTPDMNAFVTDFIVCNVATHVQRFSSGILIIFIEKLCQMWRNLD